MKVAVILFSALFLLCCLLFKQITVAIKKSDEWRVEIKFTLCTVHFSKIITRSKAQNEESSKKHRHRRAHRDSIIGIIDIIKYAEVEIYEISIPIRNDMSAQESATVPWRYHASLLTLTSFIHSLTTKLTIHDNAITLIPDIETFCIYITLKIRLFHILRALTAFVLEEKLMKRRKKYVGK